MLAILVVTVSVAFALNEATDAKAPDAVLVRESFDDAKLSSRGWYDVGDVRIAGGAVAGTGCIEYEWTDARAGVRGSSPARHLFAPTDEVAIFGPGLLPHAQRLGMDELAVGTKRIGPLAANPSPKAQPGGNLPRGIAAAYRGDAGIEKDPSVVFAENFEGPDFRHWNNAEPPRAPKVQLVNEKTRVHGGKQAVQFMVPPGKGVGAGLVKWFQPGYDQLHARWYCLFAENYDQGNLHHTGAKLAAETNRWHLGVAGQKPTGHDFFITGLEPWRDWKRNPPPGELMFYTYYPDMKRDPDGNYWGNSFKAEKQSLLERGRWYCLEIMVKANTAGRNDGEQAFWVDGELIGRFTGIRWRDTETLKLNCFWPSVYIHDCPQTNRVWMDDMVVATSYIGPMVLEKK